MAHFILASARKAKGEDDSGVEPGDVQPGNPPDPEHSDGDDDDQKNAAPGDLILRAIKRRQGKQMGVSITYQSPEAGVSVTYRLPNTGFCNCTEDEARKLMRIVDAGTPWLGLAATTDLAEFGRAFRAIGLMFRKSEPDTSHAFSYFVDAANDTLQQRNGGASVSAAAVLGAILASADIPWRRAVPGAGQLLEVGLDIHHGRQAVPHWRGLLTGERSLPVSLPPRGDRAQIAAAQRQVSFHKQQPDGSYRRIADNEPLWSRN
jgi:hypothetical protein